MSILNERYCGLPASAHLSSHRPFRYSQDDSQAGISVKIRRHFASFLWCYIMGVSDYEPDYDLLLKRVLKLNSVSSFLSETMDVIEAAVQD